MTATFDAAATTYDAEFNRTPIAQRLRQAVWERLDANFQPGTTVLELGCGTGEDAIWLAQRGVRVIATDASQAMLAATRAKLVHASVGGRIETQLLDINALSAVASQWSSGSFEGVFSNFGPLNCGSDLKLLALRLAEWTRPTGRLLFVVMGPFCLWEMLWHVLHLQPRNAFRRWARSGVLANVSGASVRVRYPTPARLARGFAPAFRVRRVAGLGVFLPPTYVRSFGQVQPDRSHRTTGDWLLITLSSLERRLAHRWPFNRLGDHYIIEFERVDV